MAVEQNDIVVARKFGDRAGDSANVTWHSVTHRGLVRRRNEDSLLAETKAGGELASVHLLAVADGLGGHKSGGIASKMSMEAVRREFRGWRSGSASHFVSQAIRYANEEVFRAGHVRKDFFDMRTTVTAVVLEQDSLTIGHVGDCRLYRVRDGKVELLTRDHTVAAELAHLRFITPERTLKHQERHKLTRSVGAEPFLRVDVLKEQTMVGDVYLLCTDGLWSGLTLDDVKYAIENHKPDAACTNLVNFVLKGGAPDNITAVVFRIESVRNRPARPFSWRSLLRMQG